MLKNLIYYTISVSSAGILKGLFPKIVSKSSLKMTSFSIKIAASCYNFSLLSSKIFMALLYSFSINKEISLSIVIAVSSE